MPPAARLSTRSGRTRRRPSPVGSVNHIAIVVERTADALAFYEDGLGLRVIDSEILADQHVRLTQLDMGTCSSSSWSPRRHPDRAAMLAAGERLHHVCFDVDDMRTSVSLLRRRGVIARDATPRGGPRGRLAVFMEPTTTRGVLFELTAGGTDADMGPDAG